jgi:hypothetical protein
MDSLPTGLIPSWLSVAATALGPLMALLVGFVGTDWLLHSRLPGKRLQTATESDERLKAGSVSVGLTSRPESASSIEGEASHAR